MKIGRQRRAPRTITQALALYPLPNPAALALRIITSPILARIEMGDMKDLFIFRRVTADFSRNLKLKVILEDKMIIIESR